MMIASIACRFPISSVTSSFTSLMIEYEEEEEEDDDEDDGNT